VDKYEDESEANAVQKILSKVSFSYDFVNVNVKVKVETDNKPNEEESNVKEMLVEDLNEEIFLDNNEDAEEQFNAVLGVTNNGKEQPYSRKAFNSKQ
jgi:2,3-bisphosphoglycerate-independent phosphoglycerate mutase